ncbi:hypothetical protein Q7C36_023192 [Tachysurus vachellii]|uniref:Uncharacterized protein n=1 Tax=Tachysurus vachellii TaxID=175792 RepID=A0AA88ILX5_TACVA|nr:hypothetical protein Q7C36_023192 [Tachysurus vachellii]
MSDDRKKAQKKDLTGQCFSAIELFCKVVEIKIPGVIGHGWKIQRYCLKRKAAETQEKDAFVR